MAMPRVVLPRTVIVLLCTLLQICFGTVYAWSFFQTLLVQDYGWTFTHTAIAFSIVIFSLGLSAAWAGMLLPKTGPRLLATAGSVMFSSGYFIGGLALHLDNLFLFYLGYGVIGGAGIGLGLRDSCRDDGKSGFRTARDWRPELSSWALASEQFLLSKVLAPVLMLYFTGGDLSLLFAWLGAIFACILIPSSLLLSDPPVAAAPSLGAPPLRNRNPSGNACSRPGSLSCGWSSSSTSRGDLRDQLPVSAAARCVGVVGSYDRACDPGRLWSHVDRCQFVVQRRGTIVLGLLSDRIGRIRVFRIILASQMVVFGILMTERNPWVFSALVCYILLCFGGGFATMPSFILDVSAPSECRPSTGRC